MKVFLLWLLCLGLAWAQDEPVFQLNVQLVARRGEWSAALPGEPELRIKGKSRNWSYFDQFRRCLFLVIDDGGWTPAEDEAGWRRTAGAVVGFLAEKKPVELTLQAVQGRPGCVLHSGAVEAQALRLEDGRHLLLAVVPFSTQAPPSAEFFAALQVPARFQGQLVSPSDSNWSVVFPAAPGGTPDDLSLQQGNTLYRARQLQRPGTQAEQLVAIQKEVQEQGPLVGQRSYVVEGLPMQQFTVRSPQGGSIHHRILWLKPDQLLWLTAAEVDSNSAQRFFSSFRRWN
ncbi:MAG: hypothetical protein J0I12_27785 [Candidatus Eremiobacteraeota bacterium]|nr:hypothetical protein [Candidatus Eremiobacteraeota bacterium]